jgi:hypothetical protein
LSKLCFAEVVTQGSFSLAKLSMKGVDQAGKSNIVGRTLTKGIPAGRVSSQLRQRGQYSYLEAP